MFFNTVQRGNGMRGTNYEGDYGIKAVEKFSYPPSDLGWPHADRRTVPRYSVLAVAEFAETRSTMCIEGRLTEISRKGCFVNTPSTLALNSFLTLVISRDDRTFTTNSKVIYVHEGIGMGLVFVDTAEEQLEILISWLADTARTEEL
jgi:PilZ domain